MRKIDVDTWVLLNNRKAPRDQRNIGYHKGKKQKLSPHPQPTALSVECMENSPGPPHHDIEMGLLLVGSTLWRSIPYQGIGEPFMSSLAGNVLKLSRLFTFLLFIHVDVCLKVRRGIQQNWKKKENDNFDTHLTLQVQLTLREKILVPSRIRSSDYE